MKKLAIVSSIIVTLAILAIAFPVTSDNQPVFKAALIDGPNPDTTAYGDIKVFSNGTLKIDLVVSTATPGEEIGGQTYDFLMDFGAPRLRQVIPIGQLTTDKKGKISATVDLKDFVPDDFLATTPGFVVIKPRSVMPPPKPPAIAVTGFVIP